MTTLHIWQNKTDKSMKAFEVFGHAGYARHHEKDIICSAVSILTINTINYMEFLGEQFTLDTDERSGLIRCVFNRPIGHDSEVLMAAMISGFAHIQKEYGKKYIEILIEEV